MCSASLLTISAALFLPGQELTVFNTKLVTKSATFASFDAALKCTKPLLYQGWGRVKTNMYLSILSNSQGYVKNERALRNSISQLLK